MKQTVWNKWECGGGSRWTSVVGSPWSDNLRGTICNFSGCGCGTKVEHRGYMHDASENWFRRSTGAVIRFNFKQTGFNAHTAEGTFTYETHEGAYRAAENMRSKPGYSNLRLTEK